MKSRIFLPLLFILANLQLLAQPRLPEFGAYSSDEVGMKSCSFEKDANAVVLLDEATADYDDDWQLITTRRVRIKILDEKGISEGDIVIPFWSKDHFEFIRNIEGMTFNLGQKPEITKLERSSIFTEAIDEKRSRVKFAMPNVKAGSIIEYKYESVMKHYGGLDRWIFQAGIPTLKSCFFLKIIPNHEFSYVITKKTNYNIVVTPRPDIGAIYFEMNNVRGLLHEPFMDAPKDYFQQVEFQLSGFVNEFGGSQKVDQTWQQLAYSLNANHDLGSAVKKGLSNIDELKLAVTLQTTPLAKTAVIYNYVRKNLSWNGYDSKFTSDGIKKAWEKRSGTSGEINLILVDLLQSFDIDAVPMIVAERDYGKVDPRFPLIERFNKTVAWVRVDGKTLVLDATEKFCPFGLTPSSLLNTYALVIDKGTKELSRIKSENESFARQAVVQLKLSNSAQLTGEATISDDQYARQSAAADIAGDQKKFIRQQEEDNHGIAIDSFSKENINDEEKPLIQHLSFKEQLDQAGGFVLLNCNLFTGLGKNPFTKDERFTNIDFGYPFQVTVIVNVDLPTDAKVDAIPADKKIVTPDRDASISRQIRQTGNTIQAKLEFRQSLTLVDYEDYGMIKEFYKQMINMLNEPLTIKLAK